MKNLSFIGRVLAAAIVSVALVSCDGVKYPHTENHVSFRLGTVLFSKDWHIEGGFRPAFYRPNCQNEIIVDDTELGVRTGSMPWYGQIDGFYPNSLWFIANFPLDVKDFVAGDSFTLKPSSIVMKGFDVHSVDNNVNIVNCKSNVVECKVKVIDIDRKTVQGITSIVYFNFSFDFVISSEITFEDTAAGETRTEQKEFHLTEGRISSILNRW